LITTDPDQLRTVFLHYLEYLRSPAAAAHSEHLTPDTVATLQAQTQTFYAFMHDNAADAATATANPRWRDITLTHTALWSPLHAPKQRRRERELTWYATADLQRMLTYLDVLAAPAGHKVVLHRPDGTITIAAGLGDPQAARIWLLQALTGRRASEILMLDHDPLQAIPGQDRPADGDTDTFVARLRYQQTKVDGIIPTILVEQAIVDIIAEQQAWLKATYPELAPRYLFLGVKNQHRGQQPRSYNTYRTSLAKLDSCHDLTDSASRPLRFTQTHRLRHTRATELQRRRSVPRRAALPRSQEPGNDRPLRGHPGRHRRSRIPQAQEDRRTRRRHHHQSPRHLRDDSIGCTHRPDLAQRGLPTPAAETVRQGQCLLGLRSLRHRRHPPRRASRPARRH
jgi:hypothetical protein